MHIHRYIIFCIIAVSTLCDAYTQNRDYFEILQVSRSATSAEIKKAFRKLALSHHPDMAGVEEKEAATKLFAEMNVAYEVLSDDIKRQRYVYVLDHRHEVVYDDSRDWSDIDEQLGIPVHLTPQQRAAREAARAAWEKEREQILAQRLEHELRMIDQMLIIMGVGAILVVLVLIHQWSKNKKEEVEKREQRNSDIRNKALIAQQQAQEREQKRLEAQQAARERAAEIAAARAAMEKEEEERTKAEEAELEAELAGQPDEEEEVEQKRPKKYKNKKVDLSRLPVNVSLKSVEVSNDDSDEESQQQQIRSRQGKNPSKASDSFSCDLCVKSYASQQQLDAHLNSKNHKSNVTEHERAKRKAEAVARVASAPPSNVSNKNQ